MDHVHVRLRAAKTDEGSYTYEEVAALLIGDGEYKLLDSPWATLGCAKDDVILVTDDGDWKVIARGGRIAVQVFTRVDSRELIDRMLKELKGTGASLDNRSSSGRAFVITIPSNIGYTTIADAIHRASASFEVEIVFSNLLGRDGKPLNEPWVKEFRRS